MRITYKVRLKGTKNEWIELAPDAFNNLSLEDGTRMPEIQGNKVIVTNYFNMFWGRIMGARNFRVFMVLTQFAYGNKEYSYPSLQTLADICDMSVNTVKAAIKDLEELGFVLQVQVINEDKEENENNIYFIRKTTPFLSVEQYQSLPKRLQEKHQEYLADIEKSERITLSNAPEYPKPSKPSKSAKGGSKSDAPTSNPNKPVDNVDNGDFVDKVPQKGASNFDPHPSLFDWPQNLTEGGSSSDGGVYQNLPPNKYNTKQDNLNHLSLPNNNIKEQFQNYLKNKVSKPSFDTWIKTVDIVPEDNNIPSFVILCDNDFQRDWLENRYQELFIEAFMSIGLSNVTLRFIVR
ncbi:putative replicon initiation protein [Brevibacillus phage SecTim467]|uniref:Putative replicon initiation protein n=2 Tax=Jenstvirus jenst TaxID=1982225 RepID=A0A0K2CNV5_9CAUD|nr:replication initiation protein [Brevibacillus phage Jenst]ALA07134.1 putative replication initiation protein [Brevibacillus phage Jenst]ALA07507.1 putative replicon initiation protein [Brevibacillus phage SecTim467]